MEHHLESNNPFYHGSQVVILKGFNFAEKKGWLVCHGVVVM